MPGNRSYLRQRFAGRPALTGERHLVFVGACLQAIRAQQQALPQATIRRQAGSYRGAPSCFCRSLPASESCRGTGLASGDDSPAGRLLQGKRRLVFVGACLQANHAEEQALPQATIRRRAGSYKGNAVLFLQEPACWRIVPSNRPCLRQRFAGRPAPTREAPSCFCRSLPASESCLATGITSGNDSTAGRLLQGSAILFL